jgi:hypothetical protein
MNVQPACVLNTLYKDYILWSSSLCSFIQYPVTSSLLGPNSFHVNSAFYEIGFRVSQRLDDQGVWVRVPVG